MPEYYGDVARAAELEPPSALKDAKSEWAKRAHAYMCGAKADEAEAEDERPKKRRKVFRVKAFSWLVATDNMLRATLTDGWKYFAPPRVGDPFKWPVMVCSPDQGSDGWCALMFLQRKLGIAVEARNPQALSHQSTQQKLCT